MHTENVVSLLYPGVTHAIYCILYNHSTPENLLNKINGSS